MFFTLIFYGGEGLNQPTYFKLVETTEKSILGIFLHGKIFTWVSKGLVSLGLGSENNLYLKGVRETLLFHALNEMRFENYSQLIYMLTL